jgi:hypothetical protein
MGVSSRKLAAALAQRLNDIVPAPLRVTAEDGEVYIYIADEFDSQPHIEMIIEDESRDLGKRLEIAVESVLSSLQDSVSEHTCLPWPSSDGRTMALPGVRSDAEAVHLWYGEEGAPVVRLPAIRFDEIMEAEG